LSDRLRIHFVMYDPPLALATACCKSARIDNLGQRSIRVTTQPEAVTCRRCLEWLTIYLTIKTPRQLPPAEAPL
jgi:hypothetical protein